MLGFRTSAYVFWGIIQPIAGVLPLRGCDAKSGAAAGVQAGGLGEPHGEVEETLSGENTGWAGKALCSALRTCSRQTLAKQTEGERRTPNLAFSPHRAFPAWDSPGCKNSGC